MMLTGPFTLQEEYLRYCVRKGLEPAAALPSLAHLGGALRATSEKLGAAGDPVGPQDAPQETRRTRKSAGRRCRRPNPRGRSG